VSERGGYDLMPEFGFKPVNKYLPPRARVFGGASEAPAASPRGPSDALPQAAASNADSPAIERLFAWADKMLSR